MKMVLDIILAVVITVSMAAIIYSVKGMFFMPVRGDKDTKVFAVIAARDSSHALEQTVKAINWLNMTGKTDMRIIISDCGMDEEAHKRAEILSAKCRGSLCSCQKIPDMIEEYTWEVKDT